MKRLNKGFKSILFAVYKIKWTINLLKTTIPLFGVILNPK